MQMTSDQLALVNHIQAKNAETRAWMAEAPNRWAGIIVEDPEHWAEYGVYSVAQYEHYMAAQDHYEIYKSIHGIRPRWMDYHSMTVEEIREETQAIITAEERQQKAREDEERQTIAKLTAQFGVDEKTLRRWNVV